MFQNMLFSKRFASSGANISEADRKWLTLLHGVRMFHGARLLHGVRLFHGVTFHDKIWRLLLRQELSVKWSWKRKLASLQTMRKELTKTYYLTRLSNKMSNSLPMRFTSTWDLSYGKWRQLYLPERAQPQLSWRSRTNGFERRPFSDMCPISTPNEFRLAAKTGT